MQVAPWRLAARVKSAGDDAEHGPAGAEPGAGIHAEPGARRAGLLTIAREWGRIGCIGFGGPPAHIALLRKLCVDNRRWLSADEFEDGVAATNLLPGPASTQLAIYCAWRLAGPAGALLGGACFIVPGLIVILALSALFLASHPPDWVAGAAAGAGAAVPAVAAAAAIGLMPASWRRAGADAPGPASGIERDRGRGRAPRAAGGTAGDRGGGRATASRGWRRGRLHPGQPGWPHLRWIIYLMAGGVAAALAGPFVVLILAACGLTEVVLRQPSGRAATRGPGGGGAAAVLPFAKLAAVAGASAAAGGLLAVAWVAFKVGALSYGGGFVIIPLMQHDAVHTYHWMTGAQFLSAVALGQVTPGPVVQTVAVVGYAAAGVGGGLLASVVAFAPSFAFVLVGGPRFAALRSNTRVQAFLTGAGPAAIGAIAGATVPLALELGHLWQFAVLVLAAIWLIAMRRNVVAAIIGAAALGVIAALAGAPIR